MNRLIGESQRLLLQESINSQSQGDIHDAQGSSTTNRVFIIYASKVVRRKNRGCSFLFLKEERVKLALVLELAHIIIYNGNSAHYICGSPRKNGTDESTIRVQNLEYRKR